MGLGASSVSSDVAPQQQQQEYADVDECDSEWLELDLEPLLDGARRRLAIRRKAFTLYGRSETLVFTVKGGGEGVALTLDPVEPERVRVHALRVHAGPPGSGEPREIVAADCVERPSERALRIDFSEPPLDVRDVDAITRRFASTRSIPHFFAGGQGFASPRYISRFAVDRERGTFEFVASVEAPKTQYLRRQVMLLLLAAVRDDADERQLDRVDRLFFAPFSGTVRGLDWSWLTMLDLVRTNRALFAPDIGRRMAAIGAWLSVIDQAPFDVQ